MNSATYDYIEALQAMHAALTALGVHNTIVKHAVIKAAFTLSQSYVNSDEEYNKILSEVLG